MRRALFLPSVSSKFVRTNAAGRTSLANSPTGDCTLSFGSSRTFGAGSVPSSVTSGDFNGDGKRDLAVANNFSSDVSILLGNGDGTFQAAVNYVVGNGPSSVAAGDFNGDGHIDLVTANTNSGDVSILLGNGDGTFLAAVNYGAATDPYYVVVGRFEWRRQLRSRRG